MPDWIKNNHNGTAEEGDVLAKTKNLAEGEYNYIAFYSDREVSGGKYKNGEFAPDITDTSHLLELRVFDCEREFKAVRTQIGKAFKWRIADEIDVCKELYVSETQLLDIDAQKKFVENDGTTTFSAMGGGRYTIPAEPGCDSVELVNYIKYDEYGNMQFADFRIKRFFNGGAENA